MIRTMWNKILALFGKKKITNEKEQEENESYVYDYEDIKDINFTAIFANKLIHVFLNKWIDYRNGDCSLS